MSKVELSTRKYKTFDRSNGRHGQIIVVSNDDDRSVEVECVDQEEFDFSKIPLKQTVSFEADIIFRFQKSLSKNNKEFYLNYATLLLKSCDDIEID